DDGLPLLGSTFHLLRPAEGQALSVFVLLEVAQIILSGAFGTGTGTGGGTGVLRGAATQLGRHVADLAAHGVAEQVVDDDGGDRDQRHDDDVLGHALAQLAHACFEIHENAPVSYGDGVSMADGQHTTKAVGNSLKKIRKAS